MCDAVHAGIRALEHGIILAAGLPSYRTSAVAASKKSDTLRLVRLALRTSGVGFQAGWSPAGNSSSGANSPLQGLRAMEGI